MKKLLNTTALLISCGFLQSCSSFNGETANTGIPYIPAALDEKQPIFPSLDTRQWYLAQSIGFMEGKRSNVDVSAVEGFSKLLDVTKQHNGIVELHTNYFPQQKSSKRKILILESLDKEMKRTVKVDAKGYVKIDDKGYFAINYKNAIANKKIADKASNHLQLALAGPQVGEDNALHDLQVLMYASKGIKGYFQGYLNHPSSAIDYFETIKSPTRKHRIPKISNIYEKFTQAIAADYRIISMSFRPDMGNLEELSNFASADVYVSLLNRKAQNEGSSSLSAINLLNDKTKQQDFLWLMALDNLTVIDDRQKNKVVIEKLDTLQRAVTNLVYVSSVSINAQNEYTHGKRTDYLKKGLDVYSIIAPPLGFSPIISPEHTVDITFSEHGTPTKNAEVMATSMATPIMSTIMHNIWSMAPDFSAADVLYLLRTTARSTKAERDKFGYIVDPIQAYKYTLGYLIAESYRHSVYPSFNKGDVKFNANLCIEQHCNVGWHIDEAPPEKPLNRTKVNVDVDLNNVYVSSVFGDSTLIKKVSTKRALAQSGSREIRFTIDKVDFNKEKITVFITKEFKNIVI
jgi:hypothetical protein